MVPLPSRYVALVKKFVQWASEKRAMLIQVGFVVMVVAYLFIGAAVFRWLEDGVEIVRPLAMKVDQELCMTEALVNITDDQLATDHILACVKYEKSKEDPWKSFANALIFTSSVVTTIGYGNVAPATTIGRLFCVVYGLIGIPFTMLTVASFGKLAMELTQNFTIKAEVWPDVLSQLYSNWKANGLYWLMINRTRGISFDTTPRTDRRSSITESEAEQLDQEEAQTRMQDMAGLFTMVMFATYIFVGACIISQYEPQLDFMTAIYFNFVTLTTMGLGDLVPSNVSFMWLTILYILFGLGLTTNTLDMISDQLKRLHYAGRDIVPDPARTKIQFGGKTITVKELMMAVAEQYGCEDLKDMSKLTDLISDSLEKEEEKRKASAYQLPNISSIFTITRAAKATKDIASLGVDLDYSSVQPHFFSSYTGDMSFADDTLSDISTYTNTYF